jgi:hypothetical protein
MYASEICESKRGPSTALRASEKRGKGKDARNSAQDDDVTAIAANLLRAGWAQSEDTKKIFTPGVGLAQVPVGVKKNRLR